jgi:Protein of unknown function (DUF3060)
MRRSRVRVSIMACLGGSLVAIAAAQAQTTMTSSGQRRSIACDGETVQITGSRNTLTITGDCQKVDVAGTGNVVTIEAVERIEVTGTNNRVTWQRALRGDAPRVSRTGLGNTIARAEPAEPPSSDSAPPPARSGRAGTAPPAASASASDGNGSATPTVTGAMVKLIEDNREDTIDCRGRQVSILGSKNSLRLRGTCPLVIVSGSDNIIDIDTADRIRTSGDRNRLTWTRLAAGTEPKVQNTGTDNRVSKADR